MKAHFSAISLFLGTACSEPPSEQEAVMRAIESTVVLPAGAEELKAYSRNYAMKPDGKVIGVYVTPRSSVEPETGYGCEVALEDFGARPCTDAEVAESAATDKIMADNYGQAGQSRWFDDYRELPAISDGGCILVEIIFDPQSQRIESVNCNANL